MDERTTGSIEDFDRDWAEALATRNPRWFVYPDARAKTQVGLLEWVKARQVLAYLRSAGIRTGRVLEYGCGAAGISIYLKELGYQTYVVDLSARALEVARLNDACHRTRASPLRAVVANSLDLPMADGTFDAVMSYGLLEHFDSASLSRLLGEVVRVLRPGGVFVADIVPARPNARTFGNAVNFAAASAYYLARRDFATLRDLPRRYFEHYYETSFGPAEWRALLRDAGLSGVDVRVCRPFPLLAVTGDLEAGYVRLMRGLLPLWLRFDRARLPLKEYWGWMYLAFGVRPGGGRAVHPVNSR